MKKTVIITAIVVLAASAALIIFSRLADKEDLSVLFAEAKRGKFEVVVTTTGELQAERATEIRGPDLLRSRNIRIRDIAIFDLVPEGTVVEEGDYVATLDRSDLDATLRDEYERLETIQNNYDMRVLDTTLQLRDFRNNLLNMRFNLEQAEITLEQSQFEPPTTIRQNEINLENTQRSYDQAVATYELRLRQADADMRRIELDLQRQKNRIAEYEELINQLVITAPAPGMVIYRREWRGARREVGSTIRPQDPVVAELPDLSSMISRTYVNEIDISKVSLGNPVRLSVDAFPDRSYTGEVVSMANIGEQLPNTDAKVFEVVIQLDKTDPILRPAMTTGNQIVTSSFDDVVFIPLEAVYATADSIPFVYTRDGRQQVVLLGTSNENQVIVEQGLSEGEVVRLSPPSDPTRFTLAGEELKEIIRQRHREREAEDQRRREEAERMRVQRNNNTGGQRPQVNPNQMQR